MAESRACHQTLIMEDGRLLTEGNEDSAEDALAFSTQVSLENMS